ncbi:MAG: HlyD family efflux transporter periplasmic adaptor subunit [Saprospiraceae bacterium]|nr:MAG: transporter [Bacteroidetes bacterium OLB9]MCO6464167.1 HlyD family efflux transporter periplasmic adaptor subunit [Saprospiraceae bacterium]MCZ2339609.1 HlyD family efflux transporter periplasmic adaptor subunit [Chitinophagales bacterium]
MITRYISAYFITALFLLSAGCKNGGDDEITPMKQDIKEWVFAPGYIDWDHEYNITAQTEGILLQADFEVGSTVHKGSIIGVIDNQSSQINTIASKEQLQIAQKNLSIDAPALRQLEQNIEAAEAKYAQDKLQAERYERLFKSESIARIELENVQLAAESSLRNLNALKKQRDIILQQAKQQKIIAASQVKNNELIQSYNKVIVLQSGKIIRKLKSAGDFVRRGEVIAIVADPASPIIELSIDEKNISKIKNGQPVVVRLNTERTKTYNGTVDDIVSTFDESTQSFICKVKLTESLDSSLNIYMTPLEGNILTAEKDNALLIPRAYMGYGNKVRVKGQEDPVIIEAGIISSDYVEILGGITDKDILLPLKP